jgi:hypothetical protein
MYRRWVVIVVKTRSSVEAESIGDLFEILLFKVAVKVGLYFALMSVSLHQLVYITQPVHLCG